MISCDSSSDKSLAEAEGTQIEKAEYAGVTDEISQTDANGYTDAAYQLSNSSSQKTSNQSGNINYLQPKAEINRKIIWTANLKFQVKNVDTSTKSLQNIIKKHNGYISSMDVSSTNYQIDNTIQIRVSNDKFDKLIDELKGEAIFVDELKIKSNDVTEEFIDIQSRLKTKKEVRDRYIAVLRTKAGTVKDIIEAEEAIRKITEEIEAKEGRLRYLIDKVNLSTITVTLYQKVEYKSEPKIFEKPYAKKLLEGLGNGWAFIKGFVLVLVNIWPLILIVILFLWKRKWIMKKLKKD